MKIKITFKDTVEKWNSTRNRYIVTLTNPQTKEKTSFFFHDSINNYIKNIHASEKSVLDCIMSDYAILEGFETYEDFLQLFGYEANKESRKIYNDTKKLYDNLHRVIATDEDFEKIFNMYKVSSETIRYI